MWAVGRLSLLSRGLAAAKAVTPAVPGPVVEGPASGAAPSIQAPEPRQLAQVQQLEPERAQVQEMEAEPSRLEEPRSEAAPRSPEPVAEPPGFLQRIVTRVKGFFRSIFG